MTVLDAPGQALFPAGTADRVLQRLFPPDSAYKNDPDRWATERLGVESWSKPREIRASVLANRYTAVQAGHEVAKSHTAATLVGWWVDTHPPEDTLVVSTAPVHHQVQGVLWGEIAKMHERGGLPGRLNGLGGAAIPEWWIGSRRVAFGRAPDRPSYFQGYHAKYTLVIIDEAGEVPGWLFHRAESLAANDECRIVALGNPYDPTAEFASVCAPGSGWNVIQIGAFDTPHWTGEHVSDDLLSRLVSDEYVTRLRSFGEDFPLYQTAVLGRFPDISDDTLFPPAFLRRAHETELAGMQQGGYGGDVARYGDDETVVYRNRGGVLRLVDVARKQSLTTTSGMFARILKTHGPDEIPMNVDGDGIGGSVVDQLRDLALPVIEFRGGMKAVDKERFANRRAEMFWLLREAMDRGEIDLDPLDLDLAAQLGKLKWKTNGSGLILVESKEDMRKRGVKSPDRADAAAMAYVCPGRAPFAAALAAAANPDRRSETGDLMEVQW